MSAPGQHNPEITDAQLDTLVYAALTAKVHHAQTRLN